MLKAIGWYINKSIFWGSGRGGGQGGSGNSGGVLQNSTGPLSQNIFIFLEPSAQAQKIGTLVG
jgi:hypothetical protein